MGDERLHRHLDELLRALLYSWLEQWANVASGEPDAAFTLHPDLMKAFRKSVEEAGPREWTALIDERLRSVSKATRKRLVEDKGLDALDIDPPIEAFGLALRHDAFMERADDVDSWLRAVLYTPHVEGPTREDQWLDGVVSEFPPDIQAIDLSWRHSPLLTDLGPLGRLPHLRAVKLVFAALLTDLSSLASVETLESLTLENGAARDLEPLARLPRLKRLVLDLEHCDVAPLGRCTKLVRLHVRSDDRVRNASALGALRGLKALRIKDPEGDSVGWLSELTELRELYLSSRTLRDASPVSLLVKLRSIKLEAPIEGLGFLRNLPELESLSLDHVPLEDLAPIADLTNLRWLHVGHSRLKDLSALRHLEKLETLAIRDAEIESFTGLEALGALRHLSVNTKHDADLGPLANLTELESLDLHDTPHLLELGPLAGLKKLALLDIAGSDVNDLTPLAGLESLESLDASETEIESLDPLAGLPRLARVDVHLCPRLESLKPLAQCPRLDWVDAHTCDTLKGARSIGELGGPVAFDLRNHLPKTPPQKWSRAERRTSRRYDTCRIEVQDGSDDLTAVKVFLSLLPPMPELDSGGHTVVVRLARRGGGTIPDALAKRILERIRACGAFRELPKEHDFRVVSEENARVFVARAEGARRMAWGAYVDRPPLLVVPSCPAADKPPASATYELKHHIPRPFPEEWDLLGGRDKHARFQTEDAQVDLVLLMGADIVHLGVGIGPLPGDTAVVSDEVARGILEKLRNRGEIQETGYGPIADMPGIRLFEATAWPA